MNQGVSKIKQAESIRNLGEAYLAAGNSTLALREFLKAYHLNRQDAYLHNDLGLAYLAKNRLRKSVEHFKKAVELKPDFAPAINNLGTSYLALKEWDKAIRTFLPLTKNILYATPQYAESNLAFAYLSKGNYIKAEYHYNNAIDLAPNYVIAKRGLAILYRNRKEYKKALKLLKAALRISPKDGELYFQYAKTLEANGNVEKAKKAYVNAIKFGEEKLSEKAQKRLGLL